MRRVLLLLLPLFALTAPAALAAETAAPQADAASYLQGFVDPSVSPREDFFRYAVGKWLAANPIPPSERAWGIFQVVQEETYARLVSLSEQAAADGAAPAGSNAQKIGDFWSAAMDSEAAARQGIAPLAEEFARIAAVKDRAGLLEAIARLQTIGAGPMCRVSLYQDEMNSDRYVVHLFQGGLGLPSRDYYVDDDARSRTIRREYLVHLGRMFGLLGEAPAAAQRHAAGVMALETELARASRKLEDLRDPHANYHAMAVDGVSALTPSIRWRDLLGAMSIRVDTVVVGQPEFFQQVEKSLRAHSVEEWKTYLRWNLVNAFAAPAGGKFDEQDFRFYGTVLNGVPQQRPRWKRVLDLEEQYLGDALGQLYVARYFSPRAKERYVRLTDDIFAAFRERVGRLDWMSPATRERALAKLATVNRKVGYPERWRDYSSYRVERGSFLGNCLRGNVWQLEYLVGKLHKPVDRTEWDMTPQTYNAYYNPSNNEIVLPAAIFILPGIADSLVDDAIVYAYAGGSTIGHELTHGFDDQGRQFDERGNLRDWWTKEDGEQFQRRSAAIVKQFDEYVAVGDVHCNGSATQGENIADLAGVELAWDAFTRTDEYRQNRAIGGYTPAQRFFIGWALSWMIDYRPENMAMKVKTDVHAPAFLRVIGPLSNLPQFYEAFGVKPGDRMFRADAARVKVW